MKQIKQKHTGFTLIELLVVISIVGVMVSFAMPSLTTMVKNGKLTTTVNNILADFNFARNEAISKGVRTALCPSNNGNNCNGGSFQGSDWILTWHDLNENGVIDANERPIVRKRFELFKAPIRIDSSAGGVVNGYFSYVPSGIARSAANNLLFGNFVICDDRSGPLGRQIFINATGRVRVGPSNARPVCP